VATAAGPRTLPRELAPGLVWIGNCSGGEGRGLAPSMVHSNNSVYVVSGTERSLLVDTGHPKDWAVVERQLDGLLAGGIPPVAYIFPTHVEPVHAGNLGRLLEKFPDAVVCGDVRDYHLVFPQFADRLVATEAGEGLELGGRRIELLDAIFHDSLTTRWAYDPVARTLFTADGFAYLHFHLKGHCGKSAEEIPDLPVKELTGFYGEFAFYWTRFVDIEPHVLALERLLAERHVDVIAPSHGSPILDPAATFPKIVDGMRFGRQATREEIVAALVECSAA
jgi:flavorubredoxin